MRPLAPVALLLAITAVPHVVAAAYDLEAYRLITSVFAAEDGPTPMPSVFAIEEDFRAALAEGESIPGQQARKLRGRVNVVLLGGDAGPGRSGLRTDTIIVASLRRTTNRATLFGVPRNLSQIPLPDSLAGQFSCRCFPRPANELYGWGTANAHLFPGAEDPGAAAVSAGIGELLGITIDHFALVDLRGFVEVVDALGGVTLTLEHGLRGQFSPSEEGAAYQQLDLPPGRHELTGEQALAYVRARQGASDYVRMARQRCFIGAVAREARPFELVKAFPRLARTMRERVGTDIPVRALPELVEIATQVRLRETVAISFTPPAFSSGIDEMRYPIADVDDIRATVIDVLEHPAKAARESEILSTLSEACP